MKKAVKIGVPYLLAVAWFVYCFIEIENSVLSHSGYEWCVIDSYALAMFSVLILLIAKLLKKEIYAYYFVPVIFWWSGIILNVIGSNIPCCSGG